MEGRETDKIAAGSQEVLGFIGSALSRQWALRGWNSPPILRSRHIVSRLEETQKAIHWFELEATSGNPFNPKLSFTACLSFCLQPR